MKTLRTKAMSGVGNRSLFDNVIIAGAHTQIVVFAGSILLSFLFAGPLLQTFDRTVGVLDIGILSVLLVGILGGLVAMLLCLWLQELLWQPFQTFRKQFYSHFNQLTSWQQCILYFSVFFLLLYALLLGLAMVL